MAFCDRGGDGKEDVHSSLLLIQLDAVLGIEPGSVQLDTVADVQATPPQAIHKGQKARIKLGARKVWR